MTRGPWPWEDLADHVGQVPGEHVELLATAERAVQAAGAQRVAEEPWGLLLRSQFTPDAYEANQAIVTSPDADPSTVLDAVEQAAVDDGLGHRRVRVDVADLVDDFRRAVDERWTSVDESTEALMLGVSAPDRRVDASAASPVLLGDLAPLMAAARSEEPWGEPVVVRQLATQDKRLAMAFGEPSALGVLVQHDGEPIAGARVLLVGPFAQLEEVHVLEPHRGEGLGRVVTQAAMELAAEAGAQSVFLTADAEDWPWRLYARMGFATALVHTTLTRPGPPAMAG